MSDESSEQRSEDAANRAVGFDPDSGGSRYIAQAPPRAGQDMQTPWSSRPRGTNSTNAQALASIAEFKKGTAVGKFKLDRDKVADRLTELVENPNLLDQGAIQLCGPAAFCRVWLGRDPLGFVNLASSLYDKGYGLIGKRRVMPSDFLKKQDWDQSWFCSAADWMVMCSLRDDENLLPFTGTKESGGYGTTASEIVEWLDDTGLYSRVSDETDILRTMDLVHARTLLPTTARDVILFINARMVPRHSQEGSELMRFFPNHIMVLDSSIVETNDEVECSFWSWGSVEPLKVSKTVFEANYHGAVIADVKN